MLPFATEWDQMGWQIGGELGSTITSTARVYLWWFDMLKSTIPCEESWVAEPPIPLTFMEWCRHCKLRRCAELSIIKKMEDAETNRSLSFIAEPPALSIWTWYILSMTGWPPPSRERCVTMPDVCFKGVTPLVCFWASVSIRSQEWWGFWHFLDFWPQQLLARKNKN